MSSNESSDELLDQAKKDYGTPAEREQRAADSRGQSGDARAQAAESGSWRGKRR